jgi:hypothetical protein
MLSGETAPVYLVCDAATNRDIGYAHLPEMVAMDSKFLTHEGVYLVDKDRIPAGCNASMLRSPEEFHLWAQGGF